MNGRLRMKWIGTTVASLEVFNKKHGKFKTGSLPTEIRVQDLPNTKHESLMIYTTVRPITTHYLSNRLALLHSSATLFLLKCKEVSFNLGATLSAP
jgi:hypothetical protein